MSQLSPDSVPRTSSQAPKKKGRQARCAHLTEDSRRCRLAVSDARSGLCFRHHSLSQASTVSIDPETSARELLGDIEDFSSAGEINFFLGNLVRQFARKRIARPDALALAYLGQLLLNSLPALRREEEDEKDALAGEILMQSLKPNPPPEVQDDQPQPRLLSSRK